jgi:hypothetical protein
MSAPHRIKKSESRAPNFDEDIYDASPAPFDASMSVSPGTTNSSDKENRSRRAHADKSKGPAAMSLPLRQESSLSVLSASENRRKRRGDTDRGGADSRNPRRRRPSPQILEDEEDESGNEAYDPDQDVEERRRLRKELRDLTRDLNNNRAEYLAPLSTGLVDTLVKANRLSTSVKQTADATIDSRLLVTTADLSYRKTVQLTLGDSVQGVDVDEFITKCILLMRSSESGIQDRSHEPSNTQRRHRRQNADEDEDVDGDEGDSLNWEALGNVALQHNARPSVPGFLLGPLSLEKRARRPTQRRQGLKTSQLKQTQPEILNPADIEKAENANLTVLCTRILARLQKVQIDAESAVEAAATGDMSEDEVTKLMMKHGVHPRGGVDLFKFVVNPYSFGQTVENMFYVSFLIRDGKVGVTINDNGLAAIGNSASLLCSQEWLILTPSRSHRAAHPDRIF